METSLKTGFAQIFSCCPNNLSCPKFGGGGVGCSPPRRPPARTPMYVVCSGIPLVLYALISSQDDVVSRLLQKSCSPPEERFEHLKKIKVVSEKKKQTSAQMFGLIGTEHPREPGSFQRLVFTVWSRKSISIYTSIESQLIGHVFELTNRSLLVQISLLRVSAGTPFCHSFTSTAKERRWSNALAKSSTVLAISALTSF